MVSENLASALSRVEVRGSLCNRDACREEVIVLPTVMAQLVQAVYLLGHMDDKDVYNGLFSKDASKMWEENGYVPISCNSRPSTWYVVFEKSESCPYTKAPRFVIAVRGTIPSKLADWLSNFLMVAHMQHREDRYKDLERTTKSFVGDYGHTNVALAGHSLGASYALLAGKAMCKLKKPVETYLFNPPLPSFDLVCSKALRKLWRGCKAMHLAASLVLGDHTSLKRYMRIFREFHSLSKWTPNFYLNVGDLINRPHLNRLIDIADRGESGFRAKVNRWVAPYMNIVSLNDDNPESFLVPSANYTVVASRGGLLSSHSLEQWYSVPKWHNATRVEGLSFGRQLTQRLYPLQRERVDVRGSDVDVFAYCQNMTSRFAQGVMSLVTVHVATSKQKQVILLCNTKQDAQVVRSWPEAILYKDMNTYIAQARSLEFRLEKVKKGDTTFYVYAVRRTEAEFQRELNFRGLVNRIWNMPDDTNWIKVFHFGLLAVSVL